MEWIYKLLFVILERLFSHRFGDSLSGFPLTSLATPVSLFLNHPPPPDLKVLASLQASSSGVFSTFAHIHGGHLNLLMTYLTHSCLGDFGLSAHLPQNWTSPNDLILLKGCKHFLYAEILKFLSLALISSSV